MLGTIANTAGIIIGGLIGLLIKKQLPQKMSDGIIQAMALGVLFIGISGVVKGNNALIIILSVAISALIGVKFDFDAKLNKYADLIQNKLKSEGNNSLFSQGLVTGTLLFCIGAMGIVGAIQSGVNGNNDILYTKTILDFVIAIVLAASLGAGVIFSAVPLFVYLGAITLLAQWASAYLSSAAVADMTATGSLLIIAIALNLLKLTDIKVFNYVLAIFLPIVFNLFIR